MEGYEMDEYAVELELLAQSGYFDPKECIQCPVCCGCGGAIGNGTEFPCHSL